MAISDYILCCKCDVKLIYDGGKDNNRQWWEERWGKEPEIMCPDCEKKLEPVAYIHETGFLVRNPGATLTAGTKLYAAPKREWVGLTDEEYTELWGMKPDLLNFFRKIEAKLKEKNCL